MKAFAKRFTCALCLLLALALLPVSALAYAPPAVESVSFNVSIESGPGDLIPQAKIDALTTSPTGAAAAISGTLECYSIAMADLEKIPRVNSAGAFYREMSSNDLVTPESPGNVLHADRRYYVMARLTLNSSRFRFTEETAATVDGKSQNINMLYRESDTALIVVNVFVFNGEQVQEEKVEIDSVNLTFNPHVSHAGKIPNVKISLASGPLTDEDMKIEGRWQYYDREKQGYLDVTTDTFENGVHYRLMADCTLLDDESVFAEELQVFVNNIDYHCKPESPDKFSIFILGFYGNQYAIQFYAPDKNKQQSCFTSDSLTYTADQGTAVYDPLTGVLTLNDFVLMPTDEEYAERYFTYIEINEPGVTVVLNGDASVCYIDTYYGDLYIKGNGNKLNLQVSDDVIYSDFGTVLDNVIVNATSFSDIDGAIYDFEGLTLRGKAQVTVHNQTEIDESVKMAPALRPYRLDLRDLWKGGFLELYGQPALSTNNCHDFLGHEISDPHTNLGWLVLPEEYVILAGDSPETAKEMTLEEFAASALDQAAYIKITSLSDPITLGDVDANGTVNAVDALMVLRHAVGKLTLDNNQQTAANVNFDDKINAVDALWILQAAVGKRTLG